MKYSIIIRTCNEERYLPALLAGIALQNVGADEVETIIVDSGSTDRTLEIGRVAHCRIVSIAKSDFSFGRSLNYGCKAARGQVFVFVSGHCVPCEKDWLEKLAIPLLLGKSALSYGRQVGGPETKFSEHQLFDKYFPPHADTHQNPIFCNNANAAINRHVWEANRFDEELTGLEDMDMGRRLVERGMRIAYVPGASVFHYHHEEWWKIRRRYEREALALKTIMPSIQVSASDAFRYFVSGVLGDFSKSLYQKQFLAKAGEIIAFRFCQYFGTWRGQGIHRHLSHQMKEHYFYPHLKKMPITAEKKQPASIGNNIQVHA